jgi:hypothetical protein
MYYYTVYFASTGKLRGAEWLETLQILNYPPFPTAVGFWASVEGGSGSVMYVICINTVTKNAGNKHFHEKMHLFLTGIEPVSLCIERNY